MSWKNDFKAFKGNSKEFLEFLKSFTCKIQRNVTLEVQLTLNKGKPEISLSRNGEFKKIKLQSVNSFELFRFTFKITEF